MVAQKLRFSCCRWVVSVVLLLSHHCNRIHVNGHALEGQTQLKVLLPQSLATISDRDNDETTLAPSESRRHPKSYDHRPALFGIPPYGGSIIQALYYVDSDFCNPDGRISTYSYHPTSPLPPSNSQPFLLMLNRGGCTFVKKVRNAQHLGAAGVLIADNVCLCSDTKCRQQTASATCEDAEPVMADDGSGSDITIPSFLVYKHDADLFKQTILLTNQTMRVEMYFAPPPSMSSVSNNNNNGNYNQHAETQIDSMSRVPPKKARVTLDYWMSPANPASMQFLLHFQPIAWILADQLDFTPHMYLINGTKSGCTASGATGSNRNNTVQNDSNKEDDLSNLPCYNLCTNRGRYCAPDPDGSEEQGATGALVVEESLRQLCIWSLQEDGTDLDKKTKATEPPHSLWWKYLVEYYDDTFHTDTPLQTTHHVDQYREFVDQVFKGVRISKDEIQRCIDHSGGLSNDHYSKNRINSKLDSELELQQQERIYALPSVLLNQVRFEPVTILHVLTAICDQLNLPQPQSLGSSNTLHHLCRPECLHCSEPAACAANGGWCPTKAIVSSSSISKSTTAPYKQAASMRSHAYHDHTHSKGRQQEAASGVSHLTFACSLLMISSLAVLLAFVYHRRSRREARQRVRAILMDYMPLRDHGETNPNLRGMVHSPI